MECPPLLLLCRLFHTGVKYDGFINRVCVYLASVLKWCNPTVILLWGLCRTRNASASPVYHQCKNHQGQSPRQHAVSILVSLLSASLTSFFLYLLISLDFLVALYFFEKSLFRLRCKARIVLVIQGLGILSPCTVLCGIYFSTSLWMVVLNDVQIV